MSTDFMEAVGMRSFQAPFADTVLRGRFPVVVSCAIDHDGTGTSVHQHRWESRGEAEAWLMEVTKP